MAGLSDEQLILLLQLLVAVLSVGLALGSGHVLMQKRARAKKHADMVLGRGLSPVARNASSVRRVSGDLVIPLPEFTPGGGRRS